MIIPFPTPELELKSLQDKGDSILAKLNAMKLQKGDIHQIEQLERMHKDCLKYTANLWASCARGVANKKRIM